MENERVVIFNALNRSTFLKCKLGNERSSQALPFCRAIFCPNLSSYAQMQKNTSSGFYETNFCFFHE